MRRRVDVPPEPPRPAKKAKPPRPKSHTPEVRDARALYRNGKDQHPEPDDPLMIEKIVQGIMMGLKPHLAAVRAGVSARAWRAWRSKAEVDAAGGRGREVYGALFRRVELARTEAMGRDLALWVQYANESKDWRGFEARMKRLYSEEYGDRSHVTVEMADGEATRLREIIVREVGADVAERIFDAFVQGAGAGLEPAEEGTEGGGPA